MSKTITGTYGSQETPCNIFEYKGWYCVEDSKNVNRTHEELEDGVDVEMVEDYDSFTTLEEIETLDELIEQVES